MRNKWFIISAIILIVVYCKGILGLLSTDLTEKELLKQSFIDTNKEIIEISLDQMNQFGGNMLQVKNTDEKSFIIMSERAYLSLNESQKSQILKIKTHKLIRK